MFERYAEDSRRSIFFARESAFYRGAIEICPEDILVGIIRESGSELDELQLGDIDEIHLREDLQLPLSDPIRRDCGEGKDIGLSKEARLVLAHTAEEADLYLDQAITPGHLLRGILRSHNRTIKALCPYGITLETCRANSGERRFSLKQIRLKKLLPYAWIVFLLLFFLAAIIRARFE